ncbi:hypothetical protein BJ166DRAFT_61755 [Pestalotiopsis sp. NC0098]|nr:hypothetical protein BJ166DRAFT_61755 [Pestalotiopsis sp. NC0098]
MLTDTLMGLPTTRLHTILLYIRGHVPSTGPRVQRWVTIRSSVYALLDLQRANNHFPLIHTIHIGLVALCSQFSERDYTSAFFFLPFSFPKHALASVAGLCSHILITSGLSTTQPKSQHISKMSGMAKSLDVCSSVCATSCKRHRPKVSSTEQGHLHRTRLELLNTPNSSNAAFERMWNASTSTHTSRAQSQIDGFTSHFKSSSGSRS